MSPAGEAPLSAKDRPRARASALQALSGPPAPGFPKRLVYHGARVAVLLVTAAVISGLFPPVEQDSQPRFEVGQIAPHDRLDIGVHDGGRDALILLDLRQHVAGARDADVGQRLLQPLDGGKLMRGIEIGMQEAHRDRGRARLPNAGDGVVERFCIERNQDLAIGAEPLFHTEAEIARRISVKDRAAVP